MTPAILKFPLMDPPAGQYLLFYQISDDIGQSKKTDLQAGIHVNSAEIFFYAAIIAIYQIKEPQSMYSRIIMQ